MLRMKHKDKKVLTITVLRVNLQECSQSRDLWLVIEFNNIVQLKKKYHVKVNPLGC